MDKNINQPSKAKRKVIKIKFQEEDEMHLYELPAGFSLIQGINKVLADNRNCDNLYFHHIQITEGNKTKFL